MYLWGEQIYWSTPYLASQMRPLQWHAPASICEWERKESPTCPTILCSGHREEKLLPLPAPASVPPLGTHPHTLKSPLGNPWDADVLYVNVLNWERWDFLDWQKLLNKESQTLAGASQQTRKRGQTRREGTRNAGGKWGQLPWELRNPSCVCPDRNRRNALMALRIQDWSTLYEDEEKPVELYLFRSQISLAKALSSKGIKSK